MFILSFKNANKSGPQTTQTVPFVFLLFAFAAVDVEFVANKVTLRQISLPGLFLSAIMPCSSISDPTVLQPLAVFCISDLTP
jgi:hypothetical protein